MNIGICKGCGETAELVKSHLIPESFVRSTDDGSGPPLEVTDAPGVFPKRRPIGHYDPNLLCESCEVLLGPLDEYGFEILSQKQSEYRAHTNAGEILYYSLCGVDTERLRRFLISVLWRFSASTIQFAKMVSIGSHESLAKDISFGASERKNKQQFTFMLSRFMPSSKSSITINPHTIRFRKRRYVKILFPEVQAWIKVDSQNTIDDLMMFDPSNGEDLVFLAREIDNSPEMRLMQQLIKHSHRR